MNQGITAIEHNKGLRTKTVAKFVDTQNTNPSLNPSLIRKEIGSSWSLSFKRFLLGASAPHALI